MQVCRANRFEPRVAKIAAKSCKSAHHVLSLSFLSTHPLLFSLSFPNAQTQPEQPWEFALIGSAAFSAGVTRAVSTAVIVFELSGENHLRLPLGVALMISYFIANRFTKGIYDALMDTNGTPHLEEVCMPCL